jgi:Uma2 family endonuclease
MPVSEETYERVALEDDETKWELVCGRLVAKPPKTTEHEDVSRTLLHFLGLRVSWAEYSVGQESPKLRVQSGNYRIPDVCVIPRGLIRRRKQELPARLEVYEQPMPLVVEVWSPSTGDVDRTDKLREYLERGDLEIWHIEPYQRTLTAWRRQPDGGYAETHYTGGPVEIASLPGVVIDLDTLFD